MMRRSSMTAIFAVAMILDALFVGLILVRTTPSWVLDVCAVVIGGYSGVASGILFRAGKR